MSCLEDMNDFCEFYAFYDFYDFNGLNDLPFTVHRSPFTADYRLLDSGYFLLFDKAVGFFVDVFAGPNGDDVDNTSRWLAVDDSESANPEAPQPLQLIPKRFANIRFG